MQKPNLFKFFFYLCIGIAIYMGLIQLLLEFELNCADCNSEDIKIHNWPDALWYTTVTLTTVGYGDMTPISAGGRIIGTVFILFSVGLYGLLIGQVATILNSVKENRRLGMNGTIFTEHVVIIGWTDFGKAVTDQLVAAGREVAIVTSEKDNIDIIREFYPQKKVFTLFSDYNNFDSLSKLNIEKSYIVFVNLNDDTEKLVYILNLKKSYENLSYIVTLDNANLKNTFITAGVTYAISKHEIASKLLASYIFEPDVAVLSEDIMSYAENDEDQDLKQFKILHNNDYIGSLYQDVFFDLKKKTNAVLLGIVKKEDGNRKLYKNPQIDLFIKEGDYLIIICNKESEIKISEKFHIKEGRHK